METRKGLKTKPKTKWLTPIGADDYAFIVKGWHPASFSWDLASLHKRQSELQKVKLILAIRPGQNGGAHPEVLFDNLPLPLFSGDKHVIKEFSPHFGLFAPVSVRIVILGEDGRHEPWGKDIVPVPMPQAFYNKPADVPPGIHMAVINGRFSLSKELVTENSYYFSKVVLVPLNTIIPLPVPHTTDFGGLFEKRPKSSESQVETTLCKFVMGSLENYAARHRKKLTAILLDCDPKYGYVIVALKQTPVGDLQDLDIQDFELDRFAELQGTQLFGGNEYLPRKQFGEVIKRVVTRISESRLTSSLASAPMLQIGYAYHDEAPKWMTTVNSDTP